MRSASTSAVGREGRSLAGHPARTTAAAAVALALVTGCGHSQASVSAAASHQLTADVSRLEEAATANDTAAVSRAAAQLRADVSAQQKAGNLSRERAAAVLAQLRNVLVDIAATARDVTPSPAPSTDAPSDDKGGDGGDGDGEGDGSDD